MNTLEFEDNVRRYSGSIDEYDYFYDMREYADDIEFIRNVLSTEFNISTSHIICYFFWVNYSIHMDAGWLAVDKDEVVKVYREQKQRSKK